MISFKLGRFSYAGCTPFVGLVLNDTETERVLALRALQSVAQRLGLRLRAIDTCRALFDDWSDNVATLAAVACWLANEGCNDWLAHAVPVDQLTVHAPVSPNQIFCSIGNYRSQVVEAMVDGNGGPELEGLSVAERGRHALDLIAERERTGQPYVCTKLPTAIVGPFDPLCLPAHTLKPDWEVELAVVIGRAARYVKRSQAMDYIAGYTIVNDITARELVTRSDPPGMGTDWLQCKSAPGFLPMGPYLVPALCVPIPEELVLKLDLNGECMQQECVGDMIFDVATQIEYISRHAQLLPGDVICTGSPAGFGSHYQRFLEPGDVVEASIAGLGAQRNVVCAEGSGTDQELNATRIFGREERS